MIYKIYRINIYVNIYVNIYSGISGDLIYYFESEYHHGIFVSISITDTVINIYDR